MWFCHHTDLKNTRYKRSLKWIFSVWWYTFTRRPRYMCTILHGRENVFWKLLLSSSKKKTHTSQAEWFVSDLLVMKWRLLENLLRNNFLNKHSLNYILSHFVLCFQNLNLHLPRADKETSSWWTSSTDLSLLISWIFLKHIWT